MKPAAVARCLICEELLYDAPTQRGWWRGPNRLQGVCFDCIRSLHRAMQEHLKAQEAQEGK